MGNSTFTFLKEKDSLLPYLYYNNPDVPTDKEKEININIPKLNELTDLPISDGGTPFIFQVAADTKSKSFTITVNAKIWQTTPEARSDIQSAYRAFIQQLDEKGIKPYHLQMVKGAITSAIPMNFTELLFYSYGVVSDPVRNKLFIDLQPGMRLRIDPQMLQIAHPYTPNPDKHLNGFVMSGSSYWNVVSSFQQTNDGKRYYILGFDSFLNFLPGVTLQPDQGGGGGLLDLTKFDYRKPYIRLFYPSDFPASSSNGTIGTEQNVTLVFSSNIADLETATEHYLSTGSIDATPMTTSFFLRGRALIVPEIAIFANGVPVYVPVGTTVRQLLEQYTLLPRLDSSTTMNGSTLYFSRSMPQWAGNPVFPVNVGIDFKLYQSFADGSDVFDIPVIKGDSFSYGPDSINGS